MTLTKEAIERAGKLAREGLRELTDWEIIAIENMRRTQDFIPVAERNGVDKEALKILKKEGKK